MENKRATLEIPEGAVFEMEADGLVIGSKDDVIIRGSIGHRLKKVFSENGSIELRSPNELVIETVETKRGTIVIAGAVRAKSLKGAKITLTDGTLSVRSVNAETSIDLQSGTIEADLVMSPQVTVSQEVRGRATVIECQNELGPHKLKGGFKMAEFLEMMPAAQKVIQSEASHLPQLSAPRTPVTTAAVNTIPPSPAAAKVAGAVAPAAATPATETWAGSAEEVPAGDDAAPMEPAAEAADGGAAGNWFGEGEANTDVPVGEPDAEATAASTEAYGEPAAEEAAPEPEPGNVEAPPVERPAYHAALEEMGTQIARVYESQNVAVPPPVERLRQFVGDGEYAALKSQLTTIWNQLIQHHKDSKLPFAVKTTQMFQSIQRTLAQHQ